MKNLLAKEIKLAMHPTAALFLFLSAMMLIPNYPYYVTFFYTSLAIFFTCLNGRENHDIFYTLSLPVRKRDVVKARFTFVIMLEILQILIAIPFALIRQNLDLPPNEVGIEANIAFFGSSLLMLGLFNLVFFSVYYKNTDKVGAAFNFSCFVSFGYILVAETLVHIVPFARDRLDTKDPKYLTEKLIALAVGIVCFILLTALSYKKSQKAFEALDL